MTEIFYLPLCSKNDRRLLQRAVGSLLQHCIDRRVAKRWQSMAFETIDQFPSPPPAGIEKLALDLEMDDPKARERCKQQIREFMEAYVRDVRDQQLRMHSTMWQLQRRVVELEQDTLTELNL